MCSIEQRQKCSLREQTNVLIWEVQNGFLSEEVARFIATKLHLPVDRINMIFGSEDNT